MNNNSMVIILLCSNLCIQDNLEPLKPSEWAKLADILLSNHLQPYDLLSFSNQDFKYTFQYDDNQIQRIRKLLDRVESIIFEIEKYQDIGINIITRADKDYPKKLKISLGKQCPPLFYYVGDLNIANKKSIGFVGSRNVNLNDIDFTKAIVTKSNHLGYAVVSGGARGVDSISSSTSIANGNCCIEYITDSLIKKIKQKDTINAIKNNRLLILSIANPTAEFSTSFAMMRNRYIYAQSEATVVVKSDYKKGGTWNGASDSIKKHICPIFCWNNAEYLGNMALIKMGAIPIDEKWNVYIDKHSIKQSSDYEQLSFLD